MSAMDEHDGVFESDFEGVPNWLRAPLPADAVADKALLEEVRKLVEGLPESWGRLYRRLDACRGEPRYPVASRLGNALVWRRREQLLRAPRAIWRVELLRFAHEFLPRQAQARIFRRLARDPASTVRNAAARYIRRNRLREVSIDGDRVWDRPPTGDFRPRPRIRPDQGTRQQERRGVPVLPDLKSLRQLLGIVSRRQLGWMLTATDGESGPYIRFSISKRDGGDREICAPRPQLRRVQRRILDLILSKIPPHAAAHGFLPGRSIVTNAQPHVGARVLLKFDLRNFFPTIHWTRVLGLFRSFGYYSDVCRLCCDDHSRNVAMVLARLCTYGADPRDWYGCHTPQGAPTSPMIANLVCRGLDARLDGLTRRLGGVFTRYADDLTLSFRDASADVGRIRWWVDQICHQEGFSVHQAKMRVIRASRRQRVTGIVVNETLRAPREQRRRFRAILHNCRRYGIESQRRGREDFESYLLGFASYLHMVDPEEGSRLLAEVRSLVGAE